MGAQAIDHAGRGYGRQHRAQPGGKIKRSCQSCPLSTAHALAARGLDGDRGPWRTERIGEALGGSDQRLGPRLLVDRDHHPFARRPIADLTGQIDVREHLAVDGLCGAAQCEFAQGR